MIYVTKADRQNWDLVPGNKIDYEYFTGITAENPTGAKNLKRIIHKNMNDEIDFVINFKYDANDDLIQKYTTIS